MARRPNENKQQQAQTECGNLSRNLTGASSTLSELFPQPKGEATKSAGTGLGVSQQQRKVKHLATVPVITLSPKARDRTWQNTDKPGYQRGHHASSGHPETRLDPTRGLARCRVGKEVRGTVKAKSQPIPSYPQQVRTK